MLDFNKLNCLPIYPERNNIKMIKTTVSMKNVKIGTI